MAPTDSLIAKAPSEGSLATFYDVAVPDEEENESRGNFGQKSATLLFHRVQACKFAQRLLYQQGIEKYMMFFS